MDYRLNPAIAVLSLLLSISDPIVACERAAGIVAYSKHNEQTLILIADHKLSPGRGWAAFGGCANDGETLEQAAAREFREETACAFADVVIRPQTPRIKQGRFTSFAAEVDYVEASQIANVNTGTGCNGLGFKERGPWAWVTHDALLDALHGHPPNLPIPLPASIPISNDRHWFWHKSATIIQSLDELKAFKP